MGGRLLQFGDESRSDEFAGCVANRLAAAQGAAAGDGTSAAGRRLPAAATGRRKREAAAWRGEALERRSARDADAMVENPSGDGGWGKWDGE